MHGECLRVHCLVLLLLLLHPAMNDDDFGANWRSIMKSSVNEPKVSTAVQGGSYQKHSNISELSLWQC